MTKPLGKSEIVGETIREVWEAREPFISSDGEITSVRAFVEFSQGQLLELTYNDLGDGVGDLAWSDISREMLQVATVVDSGEDWRSEIIGARVVEVICSPLWASFGLLCNTGFSSYRGIDSTHVRRVGPVVSLETFGHDTEDYVTGFEEKSLASLPELRAWLRSLTYLRDGLDSHITPPPPDKR
ncbi:MAG: hypothetical protein ACR2FY_08680 [Pirellulaceae bacterium]